MAPAALESNVLEKVEQSLALMRPFGDGDYINDCTRTRYERHLEMIAEALPEARALGEALSAADPLSRYRVIGDPVFRSTVHTLLAHYKLHMPQHGVEDCVAIVRETTRLLKEHPGVAPLAAGVPGATRLGPLPHHGWIWREEREDDVFGRHFRELTHSRLSSHFSMTPDAQVTRNLQLGTELLGELLPQLSRSALSHVQLVVVTDVPYERPPQPGEEPLFTSLTNPFILGTIFLAPCVLQNPWSVAEFLLHEALHQKFMDLEHTHSMLRKGYSVAESPVISPPWHRIQLSGAAQQWHVNRSISVTHVYTALALFFTRVQQRAKELEGRYGPVHTPDVGLSIRQSFDRATYLGEKLLGAKDELGVAGQRFLDWLNELLRTFDPQPPPPGSYAHLLLDLYDREAKDMANLISRASPALLEKPLPAAPAAVSAPGVDSIPALIYHLEEVELTRTRGILSALGVAVPSSLGSPAEGSVPRAESLGDLAARFRGMRLRVSAALRNVPWAAYQETRAGASARPDELVRELLGYSDRHLGRLMKHVNSHVPA